MGVPGPLGAASPADDPGSVDERTRIKADLGAEQLQTPCVQTRIYALRAIGERWHADIDVCTRLASESSHKTAQRSALCNGHDATMAAPPRTRPRPRPADPPQRGRVLCCPDVPRRSAPVPAADRVRRDMHRPGRVCALLSLE